MALTLTSGPSTSQPIPISDCLQWELQPGDADVILTNGTAAEVVFEFAASPTDPGNGTEFIIWGHAFETNSASDYTASSFDVIATDQLGTMNNFAAMLSSNFFFLQFADVVVDSGAGTVTVTWNECGEQENFGPTQMDFAAIDGSVIDIGTATNGTTPEYVDGYLVTYRLRRTNINDEINSGYVIPFEGVAPSLGCDSVEAVTFDGMPTVRRLLKTPIPALDDTHPVVEFDGILQYFSLLYGWVYRDADCQRKSGDFLFTNRSLVLNAYFRPEDVYKMRRHWPGASGGLPPGQLHIRFLTTQPNPTKVWVHSICWLWYMVNESIQSWVNLRLKIVAHKKDGGAPSTTVIVTNSGYGVNAVNVSPSYVISLGLSGVTADTLDYYSVAIFTQNSGSPTDLTQITDAFEYFTISGCDTVTDTDLYFLTPAGGIGTLPVKIVAKEAFQTGDEILLDVPCTATRQEKAAYGGRTLANARSYESFTYRSEGGDELTDFFRDLKLSPQRWVRWTSEDGTYIAKKLIIDQGGITVYRDGPKVVLEITGYTGDVPVQSGTEPEI